MEESRLGSLGEIIPYQKDDGRTCIECRFADEALLVSQTRIAELFEITVQTVNHHLANLYEESDLDEWAAIKRFRIVRSEGSREVSREIEHYNLDAILAAGFRVRADRGTAFRRWADEEWAGMGLIIVFLAMIGGCGPGRVDFELGDWVLAMARGSGRI